MRHSRDTIWGRARTFWERGVWKAGAAFIAAALSALSGAPPAAALERHGTIQIVTTVSYDSPIPANTDIGISASAYLLNEGTTYRAQRIYTSKSVKRAGASATVTLSLHYTWVSEGADVTVRIGVGAYAYISAGVSKYTTIGVAIPLPADNATTRVRIPLAL